MDIILDNLMTQKGYTPYCGEHDCHVMPRTFFNGKQFECPKCNWQSQFPKEFIDEYKQKWGINLT